MMNHRLGGGESIAPENSLGTSPPGLTRRRTCRAGNARTECVTRTRTCAPMRSVGKGPRRTVTSRPEGRRIRTRWSWPKNSRRTDLRPGSSFAGPGRDRSTPAAPAAPRDRVPASSIVRAPARQGDAVGGAPRAAHWPRPGAAPRPAGWDGGRPPRACQPAAPALVEHGDLVGQREGLVLVVRHEDRGRAGSLGGCRARRPERARAAPRPDWRTARRAAPGRGPARARGRARHAAAARRRARAGTAAKAGQADQLQHLADPRARLRIAPCRANPKPTFRATFRCGNRA